MISTKLNLEQTTEIVSDDVDVNNIELDIPATWIKWNPEKY